MDHHALRDAHFSTRFQALWETGHVTTAAAYLGEPVRALESRRHTLWGGTRKPPARAAQPGAIMAPIRRRFAKGGHAE
jgi:predicted metallo-beta-lactamase superfamily hydrolase